MRIVSPAFLALGLVQDGYQQVSGSEDDGARWSSVGTMALVVPGGLGPGRSEGSFHGGLVCVQRHIQALTQDRRVQKA